MLGLAGGRAVSTASRRLRDLGPGGSGGPTQGPSRGPEAGMVDLEALSRHTGPNPRPAQPWGAWWPVEHHRRAHAALVGGRGVREAEGGLQGEAVPLALFSLDKGPGLASACTHCDMSCPQPSPRETYSTLGTGSVETSRGQLDTGASLEEGPPRVSSWTPAWPSPDVSV